jgi:hypothetical protein
MRAKNHLGTPGRIQQPKFIRREEGALSRLFGGCMELDLKPSQSTHPLTQLQLQPLRDCRSVMLVAWSTVSLLRTLRSRKVYDVQHMREDTILSLKTTARNRPREPVPARVAVGLEASSVIPSGRSHLAGHGLAPVKAGQIFGGGDGGAVPVRSTAPGKICSSCCAVCANRRSVEWRQEAPWI